MKQILVMALIVCGMFSCGSPELPEQFGKTDGRLYLGEGDHQPLIVGLGGSEGGNAWDSDRWKPKRDEFIAAGYAFLALEYFGGPSTPDQLDRISLEGVHDAIVEAAKNPKINAEQICLIGGSKGAELALLLASKYPDIKCVVGIVPGYAAFPALTFSAETSSWMYEDKEVTFVPMPWAAVPAAITGDLREAFTIMMQDTTAVKKASIKIEDIKGSILLLSATQDEMWPSTEMSKQMMERLKTNEFAYPNEHLAIEGDHAAPLRHFDKVMEFLNRNFPTTRIPSAVSYRSQNPILPNSSRI